MSTSVVVNLFKGIAARLGSVSDTSLVLKLLKKIVAIFSTLWCVLQKSVFCRMLCKMADAVANCYGKSLLHSLLTKDAVEKRSESSLFYRAYKGIVCWITGVLSKIMAFFVELAKGSIIVGGLFDNGIKAQTYVMENKAGLSAAIFGFLIGAMFCVPHSFWNNMYALLIAFVSFILVIYGHATKKDGVSIRPDRTYISLILFFASLTLSLVISRDVGDSIRVYVFFVTSLLLCVSVSVFAASKNVFKKICVMLFACVVITGIVGIVQAALKIEADASLTDLTLNKNMPGRVFSTMGNPNNFAQVLVLFMPFAMAYVLTVKGKLKKVLLFALMLIPFVAMLQTYSRSGWIAFAVATVVFVALCNRRAVPFMFLICVLAIPFLPQSVLNRILTIGNLQDSSSSYRLVIWEGAFDMLSNYWRTGVGIGPGAFKQVYSGFALGSTSDVAHCHMQFLEVFLETGIVGFVSYLMLTFTVIKRSFMASSSKDSDIKYFGAAAAASMTSIIFIGFFEYYWFYPRVMFAFFISTGLAIAVYRMWQDEKKAAKK